MTTVGKKSQLRVRWKPKSEGGIESSLRLGREKRPSKGQWVAKHMEEIGGTLK
jgi:hypothetical protein